MPRHFKLIVLLNAGLFIAAVRGADDDKTFMWKVTSDSGSVYLVGSVHVAKKDMYPLPKRMEEAFARCTNLVVEIDEENVDPAKLQKLMVEKGVYGAGDSITKHLSKEGQAALKDYAEKSGQPIEQLGMLKPWMLAVQIAAAECQKLGFDPSLGVDKHFMAAARKDGKKILELESVEFQLGALSGFSDDLEEKFLISSILEVDKMKTEFDKLMDAWKTGNTIAMDKLLFKELNDHPELKPVFDKIFFERNAGMVDKIEGYLKSKEPHFVVMGAGHLVGDKGIIKLLENKKYKIEQIGR